MDKQQVETLAKIIAIAAEDKEKNLKVLKTVLKEEGYKLCGMAVMLMLDQMHDMGMGDEQYSYWTTLGTLNLPYHPWEAIKE